MPACRPFRQTSPGLARTRATPTSEWRYGVCSSRRRLDHHGGGEFRLDARNGDDTCLVASPGELEGKGVRAAPVVLRCDERLTLYDFNKTAFAHRQRHPNPRTALGTRRLRVTGKFAARKGRTPCSSFVPNAVASTPARTPCRDATRARAREERPRCSLPLGGPPCRAAQRVAGWSACRYVQLRARAPNRTASTEMRRSGSRRQEGHGGPKLKLQAGSLRQATWRIEGGPSQAGPPLATRPSL